MATNTNAAPRNGYEKSDASPRGLLYFVLIMAAILAATSLSLIWLFKHFERTENPGSFVAAPFAGTRPLPPPPRIQPVPGVDMQSYYQSQQNLLNTYGWIDARTASSACPSIAPWNCFSSAACRCARPPIRKIRPRRNQKLRPGESLRQTNLRPARSMPTKSMPLHQ